MWTWLLTAVFSPVLAEPEPEPEPTEPSSGLRAPPRVPLPTTPPEPLEPIPTNRDWDVLTPADDLRAMLRQAGQQLGDWEIRLAGVEVDGPQLIEVADTAPGEPILRVVREALRRPIDLEDLLYFLDDVLAAGAAGRRGEPFYVSTGRARNAGVLVHPKDVFDPVKPVVYPAGDEDIAVDEPLPQTSYPEAEDGEVLGPNWTMRFRTPTSRDEMFRTLAAKRPEATFASRMAALVSQLEQQDSQVYLTSFLRYRERGYLMWGAFLLRRCSTASCVKSTLTKLGAANRSWAHVPIRWSHPDGWRATQEAARLMADAYDVVYATERGARYSNHYDGTAADFSATGLPRELELYAPNGAHRVFDLSDPQQPRDLSVTPEVIEWIEENFTLRKLRSDHPHWDDPEG
jgi:hypothetical protein